MCRSAHPFNLFGETSATETHADSAIPGLGTLSTDIGRPTRGIWTSPTWTIHGLEKEQQRTVNLLVRHRQDVFATTVPTASLWYEMVEMFSSLGLTFPDKDRLIALDGIADEFVRAFTAGQSGKERSHTHDQGINGYTAGLLMQDLHNGLLWEPTEAGEHRKLTAFPTWSWANLAEAVVWNRSFHSKHPICTFTSVSVPADRPTSPILHVKARLHPVILGRRLTKAESDLLFSHSYRPQGSHGKYRAIWPSEDSSIIGGWGCFEGSDVGSEAVADPQAGASRAVQECTIHALYVSMQRYVAGGFHLGYKLPWHRASHVLFVRFTSEMQVQRVGIGVMFGLEAEAMYEDAEEMELELV